MIIMMPPKTSYKRGDVVLVLYPNSDLCNAKTRPAFIVQADDLQTGLPQVIVAMITSRLFQADHPSRIVVRMSTPVGRLGNSTAVSGSGLQLRRCHQFCNDGALGY